MVLLKFRMGAVIGWGIQFHIQRVLAWHIFGGPLSTKNEKYMKKPDDDDDHVFSCISHFSWSGVHQKYVEWVLVGFGIEFPIQQLLPFKI